MSSEGSIAMLGPAVARPPRLARWLAWCIRVLIFWPLFTLWLFTLDFARAAIPGDIVGRMLLYELPFVLSWLCLLIAGLVLRYWRRAMGLRLACLLLWLAPLISICDSLLEHPPTHGLFVTLVAVLLVVLRSGTFHVAGFSAFLLGNPVLRDAYGLRLTGFFERHKLQTGLDADDADAADADAERNRSPAWLLVFCGFLMMPVLLLLPMLSWHEIAHDLYWRAHRDAWQCASLAFVAPPVVLAIGLVKYRHANWLRAAALLLIFYPLLVLAPDAAKLVIGPVPGLAAISGLPHLFGFLPGTAFAWIAYFRTAPDIRARYYGEPVAGVNVDVF